MRKRLLFIFLFLLISGVISVGFGTYIVSDFTIGEIHEGFTENSSNNYSVITFQGDSTHGIDNKTITIEKGEQISLLDAPKYSVDNGYIIWNSNNGIELSLNEGIGKNVTVTESNIVFTPKIENYSSSTDKNSAIIFDSSINSNYKGGFKDYGTDSSGRGWIKLEEGNQNSSLINYGEFNNNLSVIKKLHIDMTVNINGNQVSESSRDDGDSDFGAVNGDNTISLEDTSDISGNYKPTAGGTNNKNYCVSRINLSRDLLLLDSYISLGARNGCSGSNSSYFQLNFQNFIVGQYTEIDLCGHYLIIGEGSEIRAVGSITNSNPESGGLIVESGGSLETTFTVEDHHHEQSLPVQTVRGDAPFSMYRSPYFNTNAIFKAGASYQLGMHLFFGPSQGDVYTEINLIGGSNPIFTLNGNAYIKRVCYYDGEMESQFSNGSYNKNNVLYQKVKYEIYNCTSIVNLPTVAADLGALIGSFDIPLGKENFYISPYFSFYLYNSNLTITSNFVFMPGSYLFVDKFSSITLSYEQVNGLKITEINRKSYQKVGGLNFLIEMQDYSESVKRIDDSDDSGGKPSYGGNATIFNNALSFWSILNKNHKAYCDFYGSLKLNKATNGLYRKYSIGGNINFYNYDNFYFEVNNFTQINFYANNFQSAASRLNGISIDNFRLNIFQYYAIPLISQGYVVVDPTTPNSTVTSNKLLQNPSANKYVYLKEKGVIKSESNETTFAFLFLKNGSINYSAEHLNRSDFKQRLGFSGYNNNPYIEDGYDNLDGKYYKVDYNETTHSISSSTNDFQGNLVYFHGMFLDASSLKNNNGTITAKLNLSKFRVNGSYSNNGEPLNSRSAIFTNSDYNGYSCWRLS